MVAQNCKGAMAMILKVCQDCQYHAVKSDDNEQKSHCSNENMWSIYTKCISKMALDEFIQRQKVQNPKG